MMVIVIRSLAAMIIGAHLLLPGITDYVPTITVLIHFPLSPFSSENIPPNATSSDEIALPSHYLLIFLSSLTNTESKANPINNLTIIRAVLAW